jgi:hypothetical protein
VTKVRKFLYLVLTGRTASVNVIILCDDGWSVMVDGMVDAVDAVDAVDGSLHFSKRKDTGMNQEKLG